MTTSLMNTLLSQLMCQYAIDNYHIDADYFVEGDDMYLAYDGKRQDHEKVLDVYRGLGFDPTIEAFGTLEDSTPSFCKVKFVQDGSKMVAFRELGSALAKLGWNDKSLNRSKLRCHIRSVALGLLHIYNGWPTLEKFLSAAYPFMYKGPAKKHEDPEHTPMRTAISTATHSFLDKMYGDDLTKMTKDVQKTWALNSEDYPSVFRMLSIASKPVKHNYKDQRLARRIDVRVGSLGSYQLLIKQPPPPQITLPLISK